MKTQFSIDPVLQLVTNWKIMCSTEWFLPVTDEIIKIENTVLVVMNTVFYLTWLSFKISGWLHTLVLFRREISGTVPLDLLDNSPAGFWSICCKVFRVQYVPVLDNSQNWWPHYDLSPPNNADVYWMIPWYASHFREQESFQQIFVVFFLCHSQVELHPFC